MNIRLYSRNPKQISQLFKHKLSISENLENILEKAVEHRNNFLSPENLDTLVLVRVITLFGKVPCIQQFGTFRKFQIISL